LNLVGIAAVVVHHRSYDSVGGAVTSLIAEGIAANRIIVVDNSEQPSSRPALEASMPPLVEVFYMPNEGYGAAVNKAVEIFTKSGGEPEYLLVATHETAPKREAVGALWRALREDLEAAVAGPTLISGEDEPFVWSTGGRLTKYAHFPAHFDHKTALTTSSVNGPVKEREWLDGAFLLYRWADISRMKIDESYFLYMEETDAHIRFRRAGRKILWVPAAVVWQSSGGIPPYYFARNLRLFMKRNEPGWRGIFVPFAVARRMAADVLKRRTLKTILPLVRGLATVLPKASEPTRNTIVILNPLGGALHHFEREQQSVLAGERTDIVQDRIIEPSVSGRSRLSWIWSYVRMVLAASSSSRHRSGRTVHLVLWPVLGYFDVILLGLLLKKTSLIVHDPHPLVRAIGYGKIARSLATLFANRVEIIALSQTAATEIKADVPRLKLTTLPHPIEAPAEIVAALDAGLPVVQVLGQFKKDRDVQALEHIAKHLDGSAIFRIDGRGWPEVAGWENSSRFVPEEELEQIIASSAVILIPYRRFYQSGIAIRSLERLTPVVGPRDSSLADILGPDSQLLAGTEYESWGVAVDFALLGGESITRNAAFAWRKKCLHEWAAWAE
jgi:GT2 family glycosyltransferase